MPTADYSHMVMERELMVDGDEGGEDGGEDGLRIPPPEEKSWINLSPKTKIVVAAAVCFAKAPLLLGQALFRIYEGVRRRPKARRRPRPIWAGPTRPGTGATWDPPIWPSSASSCPSFVHCPPFP
jgi:hypothetical protein